jgi:hypothetical protein
MCPVRQSITAPSAATTIATTKNPAIFPLSRVLPLQRVEMKR